MPQHSAQAQVRAQRLHRVRAAAVPQHHPKPHPHHPHAQGFGAPSLMFDGSAQVRLKLTPAGGAVSSKGSIEALGDAP